MGLARGRLAAALLLGLTVIAAPAEPQPGAKTARIGYVWLGPGGAYTTALDGLKRGLAELGYIEGRNLAIEYRYADGRPERLPIILAALVALKVDLLLTPGTIVTRAAQQATTAVPIVSTSTDPVGSGFAKSLARPGGNITGLSLATGDDFNGKWLELIKELEPRVKRIAYLWDPGGLISYGPSIADVHRRAAVYAARILKGAKPADMPIEQPTIFELVLNLKTAKAMGLTIPPSLSGRIDQVIK